MLLNFRVSVNSTKGENSLKFPWISWTHLLNNPPLCHTCEVSQCGKYPYVYLPISVLPEIPFLCSAHLSIPVITQTCYYYRWIHTLISESENSYFVFNFLIVLFIFGYIFLYQFQDQFDMLQKYSV